METINTLKILAIILVFVLAFIWGSLGGINETSDTRIKSSMSYIAGSCISALMVLLVYFILN